MGRTEQGVTQLNFKILDHERINTEMGNKFAEQLQEMQKEIQTKQPAANPASAAYGYYNMATPAKEAAALPSP